LEFVLGGGKPRESFFLSKTLKLVHTVKDHNTLERHQYESHISYYPIYFLFAFSCELIVKHDVVVSENNMIKSMINWASHFLFLLVIGHHFLLPMFLFLNGTKYHYGHHQKLRKLSLEVIITFFFRYNRFLLRKMTSVAGTYFFTS
jgi:hypothetical protein